MRGTGGCVPAPDAQVHDFVQGELVVQMDKAHTPSTVEPARASVVMRKLAGSN